MGIYFLPGLQIITPIIPQPLRMNLYIIYLPQILRHRIKALTEIIQKRILFGTVLIVRLLNFGENVQVGLLFFGFCGGGLF